MAANFDLSGLALKAVCPNNDLKYDDLGIPSVMVYVPKFTYAAVGLGSSTATFPAFIVNGQEIDGIWISKYQNIIQNGRAYSLPAQNVKHTINFDTAAKACSDKGAGWHLMTAFEWAAIALWCKNNGTMPKGNNNYGKDSTDSVYQAIPDNKDSSHYALRVKTGTGPLSWSHDGTPNGIWDLNGNVNEWLGGLRLVYGELQILANNNAADSDHPQTAASMEWKAIDATDGSLITPDGTGTTTNSIKLDYVSNKWKWISGTISSSSDSSRNCDFEAVTADSGFHADAVLLLQALALLPYDATPGAYSGDKLYANNGAAERSFFRGGHYGHGAAAGVFLGSLHDGRAFTYDDLGFRSAYCQLPAAS